MLVAVFTACNMKYLTDLETYRENSYTRCFDLSVEIIKTLHSSGFTIGTCSKTYFVQISIVLSPLISRHNYFKLHLFQSHKAPKIYFSKPVTLKHAFLACLIV